MNFIQLCSYDNYVNANIQLSLLKEEGINCYLKDEYTITIDPLLSPAIGGMKLMVDETEFEKASQILEEADKRFLQTVACPSCGEHSIEKVVEVKKHSEFFQRIKSMIVNGQEEEIKKYYQCKSCGFKFEELPQSE